MRVGDYVNCRKYPSIHGTVSTINDPLVTIRLPNGKTQDFFPSHLQPGEPPKPKLKLSPSRHGDDVDQFAHEFYTRHKDGTHYNDLWPTGGDPRQFLGFCEFLKTLKI